MILIILKILGISLGITLFTLFLLSYIKYQEEKKIVEFDSYISEIITDFKFKNTRKLFLFYFFVFYLIITIITTFCLWERLF